MGVGRGVWGGAPKPSSKYEVWGFCLQNFLNVTIIIEFLQLSRAYSTSCRCHHDWVCSARGSRGAYPIISNRFCAKPMGGPEAGVQTPTPIASHLPIADYTDRRGWWTRGRCRERSTTSMPWWKAADWSMYVVSRLQKRRMNERMNARQTDKTTGVRAKLTRTSTGMLINHRIINRNSRAACWRLGYTTLQ